MNTLQQAIADVGLGSPNIIHDGKIHRFTAPDDRAASNACWYVSFGTRGAFGSWKLGFTEIWHDSRDKSKENDAALAKQIKAAQKQRKSEIAHAHKKAQETARYLWASGTETIIHPYPEAKRIIPYGIRQKETRLLVPMFYNGQLWNIQQIQPDGTKRFLRNGRSKGCYVLIGTLTDRLIICEGYATGCSLHEHTGHPVTVAFNAGNLKQVAMAMRLKHSDIKITIAADNDLYTEDNPGLTKGREAAAAVGGDLIYPDFSDLARDGSDFNDLFSAGGAM